MQHFITKCCIIFYNPVNISIFLSDKMYIGINEKVFSLFLAIYHNFLTNIYIVKELQSLEL